ncbi:MAG TPA: DUF2079 domain-containing protein, partial [Chloroflexota bacterium]|nr:DUF2079 domain-containing protein [Chloroflexota bacterium]
MPKRVSGFLGSSWDAWLILLAAAAWAVVLGGLAIARNADLRSNAFDLGYVSQALWNTVHGRPFQFSTLINAPFKVEGLDPSAIRHPGWLFAFHIEPALIAIAPFYAAWPDPRLLLWLQAGGIALGALPAAALARLVVGGRAAALVFGAAYLLAPALEGAALSDFHMVALGAPLLMLGLFLLERGNWRGGFACVGLVALCREDAALAVAWLALLLALRPAIIPALAAVPRAAIVTLLAASAVWAALCFFVVAPVFNGEGSVFWSRYAWLGATPLQALGGVVHDPRPLLAWFGQPAVASYLALQLLTAGILALLAPAQLLAALPLLAINGLSSFDWMRSGGGHYSALLVPLLVWAGVRGAGVAAAWLRRLKVPQAMPLTFGCVALATVAAQLWIGLPRSAGLRLEPQDARAATVLEALSTVPANVAVSASSGLYPHLSNRPLAYWFPGSAPGSWLA